MKQRTARRRVTARLLCEELSSNLGLQHLLHSTRRLLDDLPGQIELLARAVHLRLKREQLSRGERLPRLGELEHLVHARLCGADLVERSRGGPLRGDLG